MATAAFDFDEPLTRLLDHLKLDLRAASRADVLRRAIILLEIAVMAEKDGAQLIIKKAGGAQQPISVGVRRPDNVVPAAI